MQVDAIQIQSAAFFDERPNVHLARLKSAPITQREAAEFHHGWLVSYWAGNCGWQRPFLGNSALGPAHQPFKVLLATEVVNCIKRLQVFVKNAIPLFLPSCTGSNDSKPHHFVGELIGQYLMP